MNDYILIATPESFASLHILAGRASKSTAGRDRTHRHIFFLRKKIDDILLLAGIKNHEIIMLSQIIDRRFRW